MGSIDSISSSNQKPRLSNRSSASSFLSTLIAIFYRGTFGINEWTWNEKEFEDVLKFDDFEGPIENVAAKIHGMTLDQIDQRCKLLVDDLNSISRCHVSAVHRYQSNEQMRAMYNDPFRSSRKGMSWSEEEHRLFLMGLNKYGKGDWRNIARSFVLTRTPTQVASHAQKYFFRLKYPSLLRNRGRSSVLNIHSINPMKSKKGETSGKIKARNYKQNAPPPDIPAPPIRTQHLNDYPGESSRAPSQYVSSIMAPMDRNFAPMPLFLGQPYGNFSNNLLNSLNCPLNGSNYGSNSFTPVLNNSIYALNSSNYVPSGLNIVAQGFPSIGFMSNYEPNGPNLGPYGMVSDTFNVDPPNFGFDGSNFVSNPRNSIYDVPSYLNYISSGSNNISIAPPAVPNTMNNPLPSFDCSNSMSHCPLYTLESTVYTSNDIVPPTSNFPLTVVSDSLIVGPNSPNDISNVPISNDMNIWSNGAPDALNPESDNPNYLAYDFCNPPNDSTDIYQWDNMSFDDYDTYSDFPFTSNWTQ